MNLAYLAATEFATSSYGASAGPGGVGAGGRYSTQQLAALAESVGIRNSKLAAAIAMAESGGDPNAFNRNRNGSVDRGLWQINSIHGGLSTFDPMGNARAMASISGGGRNWNPWTVYKSGAYAKYLNTGGPVEPTFIHRQPWDAGGTLAPGLNLVRNTTGAPEPLAPTGGNAPYIGSVTVNERSDIDVVMQQISQRVMAGSF